MNPDQSQDPNDVILVGGIGGTTPQTAAAVAIFPALKLLTSVKLNQRMALVGLHFTSFFVVDDATSGGIGAIFIVRGQAQLNLTFGQGLPVIASHMTRYGSAAAAKLDFSLSDWLDWDYQKGAPIIPANSPIGVYYSLNTNAGNNILGTSISLHFKPIS